MATEPLHAMRACRKCGIEKPHDFETFIPKLGKLTALCRECNAADCKRRYETNREARKADLRARWEANKDRYHESQRRYYRENIEKCKARDKAYREANKEKRYEAYRRWAKGNPERVALHNSRYQQSPKGKTSLAGRNRRYMERHGDRVRAKRRAKYYENHDSNLSYQRQYYADNKERFRELARQWNRKNKHKRKAIDHRRRVGNGSGRMFNASDVETILSEQGGRCGYCLADLTEYFEADHFIPLAKGGGNEPENIVLTCFHCNRSKGAKMPWAWRPDLFRPPPG